MPQPNAVTRRKFLRSTLFGLATTGTALCLPRPIWALSDNVGITGVVNPQSDLRIGATPISVAGRKASAMGVNGSVPGPLLRWREGDYVDFKVHNELDEASSIHWHGLLLPSNMDGVPGISFDGIEPGNHYRYRFPVRQNGTYWYHSHSGFQEQTGVYGPIIIDPADEDPVRYDREFVLLLSEWTFVDPYRLLKNLKLQDDFYNYNRRTFGDFVSDARSNGLFATVKDRSAWGNMRMKDSDIADITAAAYTFLLNGLDADQNWTGHFRAGERVRLRIINGSAQTFFNVRIPGLDMTVVQADGQNIEPVSTHEIQLGVAETYDAIIQPRDDRAYTIFAESMDRSGYVRGTLAPRPGMTADVPPLRTPPRVGMRDMGMDHASSGNGPEDHESMHHGHGGHAGMAEAPATVRHDHRRGPGVANVVSRPLDRLDEPGQGLANAGHPVLRYSQLRSLDANDDIRAPGRTIELHLTGNMHRYMWSFDGLKYSEVREPIRFVYGERLRMVLVNDTMMSHPIHLHGMFVELVNGNGRHNPRKHTVVVKPAERVELEITADEPGHWAFHCHMLYHMRAGMMRSVRVDENSAGEAS